MDELRTGNWVRVLAPHGRTRDDGEASAQVIAVAPPYVKVKVTSTGKKETYRIANVRKM